MSIYVCDHAWLPPGRVAEQVVIEEAQGRIAAVRTGGPVPADAERLHGLVLPGFANVHSHAFQRAMRARTQGAGRNTYWTWRERMYSLAARLGPSTLRALARAAFAEATLAGTTAIGEFHFLHHRPGGVPYEDTNALGHALVQAARDVGVRLTLLDTCYLVGRFDRQLTGVQRRFGDGDAHRWAVRASQLADAYAGADDIVIGAGIHSVQSVPRDQLPVVAAWARERGAPLHVPVSEQRAEDVACMETYWLTPTGLLDEAGVLAPGTTAIHATNATQEDLALLGHRGAAVCLCPTTERDLADGIGRARAMLDAGVPLALGSDSHAMTDLLLEARAVELDLRLVTGERGHLDVRELLTALTSSGQARLGFPDAGRLAVGSRADLVAIDLDSVRTSGAGSPAATAVFAATAADVTDVVIDGRRVVRHRAHALGDVSELLHGSIAGLLEGLELRA